MPFVYDLLTSKAQDHYKELLEAVSAAVEKYHIENCKPIKIMSDFEHAIINLGAAKFPEAEMKCCLFHLGQSLYRHVQGEGLQGAYNDPEN